MIGFAGSALGKVEEAVSRTLQILIALPPFPQSLEPHDSGEVLWTCSLVEHEVCISIKSFGHKFEYNVDQTTIINFEYTFD